MSTTEESINTIEIDKIHSTQMTLETWEKSVDDCPNMHLPVSTEFLGGRFDTKG